MVEHDTICKKGLYALYYAFYVIIEGIFKVSHSWNPIISIAGIISLLVALPLINIIRLLFLCWMDLDIPVNIATIICIIIWNGLYWLTYHYYFPAYENIEQKNQKDSMLGKIAFGMLAIMIICASIFISSWVSELYLTKWKMLR
jgi:phosphoglycerol transferase MdoB-like AlkP superfamily enzyme